MTTPDDSTNWTHDQTAEFFRGLRALKRASGSNKHDQATNLIHALLDANINTRRRIVGALRELGFNHQHVVLTLRPDYEPAIGRAMPRASIILCRLQRDLAPSVTSAGGALFHFYFFAPHSL